MQGVLPLIIYGYSEMIQFPYVNVGKLANNRMFGC